MTNKKILAARLFQTAAEPNASPERLDVLAKDVISIRETRWLLVENEPWVVNEISNTACGIWATYLTDVSMRALQDRPRDRENKILLVLPSKEAIICSIQSLDNLKAHPDAYNCWVKTEKLLKYFSDECHQCGSKAPIHVLIQWGFPNWIIWLAAKLYPQQVREFDDKANLGLPIHYCTYCGTKPFQVEGYQIQFSAGFRSEHPELYRPTSLYLLAKLYPDGATLRVSRNGPHVVVQGDLPLHTYLGYQHGEPNNSCFDLEDAKKLVELAPKSLLQKSVRIDDCVEHIFPFMVAAIPDYSRWKEAYKWRGNAMRVGESRQEIQRRNWDRINAAELEQLTAIFWLLREDPSALQAAIHSQHDYPCTKEDIEYEELNSERLGAKVAKYFANEEGVEELFFGKVTNVTHAAETEQKQILFTVTYDDGDAEDMVVDELEAAETLHTKWRWGELDKKPPEAEKKRKSSSTPKQNKKIKSKAKANLKMDDPVAKPKHNKKMKAKAKLKKENEEEESSQSESDDDSDYKE